MLTVKQAAALLGVSDKVIYRLCYDNQLAYYRFGKAALRIDPVDLEAYKQQCKIAAGARQVVQAHPKPAPVISAANIRFRHIKPTGFRHIKLP